MPPVGTLGELTRESADRAVKAMPGLAALEDAVARMPGAPPFRAALAGESVAVIAEIKRRSPSNGVINDELDAATRATAYWSGGAAALSVLTEPTRFGGSLDDLRAVRAVVDIPLLRKDFITHRVQILEARAAGAAAVLLIARALSPEMLPRLAADAAAVGLDVLIEIRDADELARALDVPDAVIGVNNRNLETLVIDAAVGARMIPVVPSGRITVYESGVRGARDVERAAALGADAVLVGSVLSGARDGEAAVRAMATVPRRRRG